MGRRFHRVVVLFLLVILLSSVVCGLITPGVCGRGLSVSERGLSVLRDFFGLDLSEFDIVVEESLLSEPFLGDVVYEVVFFTLTSEEGKLRVVFTFVEGNLRGMYVFESEGVSLLEPLSKGEGVVGGARTFLSSYERYSGRAFFGELKTSLEGVRGDKNYTNVVGDNVLEVSVYEDKVVNFEWYYTKSGTLAAHTNGVSLGFRDGFLVSFTDTWDLYRDGGNKSFGYLADHVQNTDVEGLVNQSSEVAMVSFVGAERLCFMVLFVVIVSMVGWVFLLREKRFLCFFRRFSVKGFGLFFGLLLLFAVFLPVIGSANATVPAGVIWGSKSSGAPNKVYDYYSWRKTDAEISRQEYVSRFIATKCLTVDNGYEGFSNVGANKSGILSQAQSLNAKYDYVAVFDWDHGVGGYPGTISSYNMPENEAHYMFEDDFGTIVGNPADYTVDWSHGVYDVDVYEVFDAGKVHFAFMNTCLSADIELFGQGTSTFGYPLGMPYAFTHRLIGENVNGESTVMSYDGYNHPDAFPQCYIGFPFGSAALDQEIAYNNNWQPWYEWVVFFCYMAFNFDVSVNDALDWACSMQWGCPTFGNSPLQKEGFTAIWPMWDDINKTFNETNPNAQGPHSTLAVYGNGNIHLKNFQTEHVITRPDFIHNPDSLKTGKVKEPINFSVYSVDSKGHNIRYAFDWGDGTPQTITEYTKTGIPANASHTWNTIGRYKITVRAQCEESTWTEESKTYNITIGNYYELIITATIGLILCTIILLLTLKRHKLKTNIQQIKKATTTFSSHIINNLLQLTLTQKSINHHKLIR